ncbi:endonuclease [Rufibacter ruber]|uniref:endonuclease n=1 Tax=Rufibacter ruber TaxID=1783499 RepID=UPI000A8AB6C1|nr:endonuclease [Rufibacter ruber]
MKKILHPLLALILFIWASQSLNAQTTPPASLGGAELKAWLRQNWYDGKRQVLDYGTARGRMYNYIDNYDNKVTCVYSGYQQSFTFSRTGTSTSIANINCEHTVPQSWFDEVVRMRSDIHHLFPTVDKWNSARGSDPFAEIPDRQTTTWIRGMTPVTSIPTSDIDEYSEDTNSQFEPREDHKGNLARAIFYFYTMHELQRFDPGMEQISAAANLQTLYQWHLQDPVDAREQERNNRVEEVQGNRNPYIDYPELVARAYGLTPVACSATTQASQPVFSEASPTSFKLTWTNGSGDRRLVVVKEGSASSFTPAGAYTTGVNPNFSLATDQGNGHKIVYAGAQSTVTVTGLTANQTYHVQVFEFCNSSNTYSSSPAPAAHITLPDFACHGAPSQGVTNVTTPAITASGFAATFSAGTGDSRLLLLKEGTAPTFTPQTGTAYHGANTHFSSATPLADGSRLLYQGAGTSVTVTGLQPGKTYYLTAIEACSNGWQYATGSSAVEITTLTGGGTGPAGTIAQQTFEGTQEDGWAVTSGFSSSDNNSGYPAGQRVRNGSRSLQANNTTKEVIFQNVSTAGFEKMAVELFNSSVSGSEANGMDLNDFIEVYVALNDAPFSSTPDIKITADASDSNIRYGMDGTGALETAAGSPISKTLLKSSTQGNLPANLAPSRLKVTVPDGTTSVKLKVILKNNNSNEILNLDDVTLYGTPSACTFEGGALAGSDVTLCVSASGTLGTAPVSGYTYRWSPATGLSNAAIANPTVTFSSAQSIEYTLTATNASGCTSADKVTVTAIAAPGTPTISLLNGNVLQANPAGFSYEWRKDGVPLEQEGATHTALASGRYSVRAKNEEDCLSEWSAEYVFQQTTTGVLEDLNSVLSLYPNPTSGLVTVSLPDAQKVTGIQVYNSLGQPTQVATATRQGGLLHFSLAHLGRGIYLVHLQTDHGILVRRVLVQ